MKYELTLIEILIRNEILIESEQNNKLQFQTVFNEEVKRIKISWKNEVFASNSERCIERYIQDHQKVIIELTDSILEQIGSKDSELIYSETDINSKTYLHKLIYKGLEDLLSFIEKYFSTYFNQDARIPTSYATIAKRDLKESIRNLQLICIEKKLNKKFCAIFMDSILNFVKDDKNGDLTYRYVIYVKALANELIRLANESSSIKQQEAEDEINDFLFYMNFNSLRYFKYYTTYIIKQVEEEKTLAAKLEKLV